MNTIENGPLLNYLGQSNKNVGFGPALAYVYDAGAKTIVLTDSTVFPDGDSLSNINIRVHDQYGGTLYAHISNTVASATADKAAKLVTKNATDATTATALTAKNTANTARTTAQTALTTATTNKDSALAAKASADALAANNPGDAGDQTAAATADATYTTNYAAYVTALNAFNAADAVYTAALNTYNADLAISNAADAAYTAANAALATAGTATVDVSTLTVDKGMRITATVVSANGCTSDGSAIVMAAGNLANWTILQSTSAMSV